MIFKCGLCDKYKMGKHHILRYNTLEGETDMKICELCAKYMQKGGLNEEVFRKEIQETNREIEEFSRSLEQDD